MVERQKILDTLLIFVIAQGYDKLSLTLVGGLARRATHEASLMLLTPRSNILNLIIIK